MIYNVKLTWDNDASVWIATSDDIKGLVLESNSYDALIEKVKVAAPELIELNSNEPAKTFNLTIDSKIKSRFTANAIMKQAGIEHHF